MKYSVSIDVPAIDEGLRFYRDGLGLTEVARPIAGYVVLRCGDAEIGLIAKTAGTAPAPEVADRRRYDRHWTPVHIDFHVEDFAATLARAVEAGAKCEKTFESGARPPVAFCSDPFGNGFCIIGTSIGTSAGR